MSSFNSFTDKEGAQIKLTDFRPKAIHQMLIKGHHVQMYDELASDLTANNSISITLEPLKRMSAAKKFTAQQQGLLRVFATGGLWTNSRCRAEGYDVPVVCQLFQGGRFENH